MTMLTFEPFRGLDTVTRRMFDTMSEMNRNVKQQVEQLEREFTNINDKIKNSVLSEQDIVSKVKNFAQ